MSLSSDMGQGEEEDAAGVDLQEAKMSLPRLVRRQTANIPPEERANHVLSTQSTQVCTNSKYFVKLPVNFKTL